MISVISVLTLGARGNPKSQRTVTRTTMTNLYKLLQNSKLRANNSKNVWRGIFKEKLTHDIVDALDLKKSLIFFGEF